MTMLVDDISEAQDGARAVPRKPVTIAAQIRERGSKPMAVDVIDLSCGGFQIAYHRAFHIGTMLWLKLPGLESLSATVKWSDGIHMGCQFDSPMHEAVLDRVIAAAGR